LEALRIGALAGQPFDRLSSGQRQLVLIARTLAQDARICLFDEPSATLDPAHRARVFAALDAVAERGAAVLYSTHEPGEAGRADICVTVGATIESGRPCAILTDEHLARLYGAQLASCPTCGRAG
jgi:iron complex transport system ATP-binding protein